MTQDKGRRCTAHKTPSGHTRADSGVRTSPLSRDTSLRIRPIEVLWPDDVRRSALDLFGVLGTYILSALLWLGFARLWWMEQPDVFLRVGGAVLLAANAGSLIRLCIEEVMRQWRVR